MLEAGVRPAGVHRRLGDFRNCYAKEAAGRRGRGWLGIISAHGAQRTLLGRFNTEQCLPRSRTALPGEKHHRSRVRGPESSRTSLWVPLPHDCPDVPRRVAGCKEDRLTINHDFTSHCCYWPDGTRSVPAYPRFSSMAITRTVTAAISASWSAVTTSDVTAALRAHRRLLCRERRRGGVFRLPLAPASQKLGGAKARGCTPASFQLSRKVSLLHRSQFFAASSRGSAMPHFSFSFSTRRSSGSREVVDRAQAAGQHQHAAVGVEDFRRTSRPSRPFRRSSPCRDWPG